MHGCFSGKNPVFPKWAVMWHFRGLLAQNGQSNRVISILLIHEKPSVLKLNSIFQNPNKKFNHGVLFFRYLLTNKYVQVVVVVVCIYNSALVRPLEYTLVY